MLYKYCEFCAYKKLTQSLLLCDLFFTVRGIMKQKYEWELSVDECSRVTI